MLRYGSIANLQHISNGKLPSAQAGVFVDNHDTERNGETMNETWGAKYVLANTFMLAYPYGSPSVYSGYTFTDFDAGAPGATATSVPDANCDSDAWTCTQRWTEIQGMVGFYNTVAGTALTNWWDDGGNQIAFGRGDKGFVAINNTDSATTRTYSSSLPAGTYCDVVAASDCSETITVAADGTFSATLPAYGALALHVEKTSGGTTPDPDPGTDPDTGEVSVSVHASTVWGQEVRIVGSVPELGGWQPASGVALDASGYPSWTGGVDLPAGTSFEYKYVKVDDSGAVVWESGANRTATVGADGTLALNDTWR